MTVTVTATPTSTMVATATQSPTPTSTPEAYAKIRALVDFGFFDKASQTFESAVAVDPTKLAAKEWGDITRSWWGWGEYLSALLAYAATKVVRVTGYLATILGVLAIPTAALVLLGRKQHLNIGTFDSTLHGATLLSAVTGLDRAVEEHLVRMGRTHTVRDLGVVEQAPDPLPSPAQISLPSEVTTFLGVLTYLVPKRSLELSGVLRHDRRLGTGMAVRIVHKSSHKVVGSYTFWQLELGLTPTARVEDVVVSDYLALIEAVAIWTYFTLYQGPAHASQSDADIRRAFGTANWRSYASFRLSAKVCEPELCVRLLRESLRCDPDNRYALLNLGYKRKGLATDEQRKECCERVIALAKGNFPDVARMLAQYQLGVLCLNGFAANNNGADLKSAQTALKAAHIEMQTAGSTDGEEQAETVSEEAKDSVAVMYAHSMLLDATALARTDVLAAQGLLATVEAKPYLPPNVRWNLACHYSNLTTPDLVTSLRHLELALESEPSWAADVRGDPSLSALCGGRKTEVDALLTRLAAGEVPVTTIQYTATCPELRARMRMWIDQDRKANVPRLEMWLLSRTPKITMPGPFWLASEVDPAVLQAALGALGIP